MTDDALFASKSANWRTPSLFVRTLDVHAGGFTLDAAASADNRKVKRFICSPSDIASAQHEDCIGVNSFEVSWKDEVVFLNPPFDRLHPVDPWVELAFERSQTENADVWLLVASRTETKWFYNTIWKANEIRFLKGRLKFEDEEGNLLSSAPFPSLVAHFAPDSYEHRLDKEPRVVRWDWREEAKLLLVEEAAAAFAQVYAPAMEELANS